MENSAFQFNSIQVYLYHCKLSSEKMKVSTSQLGIVYQWLLCWGDFKFKHFKQVLLKNAILNYFEPTNRIWPLKLQMFNFSYLTGYYGEFCNSALLFPIGNSIFSFFILSICIFSIDEPTEHQTYLDLWSSSGKYLIGFIRPPPIMSVTLWIWVGTCVFVWENPKPGNTSGKYGPLSIWGSL